ncbi:monocarboxylate transporter 13-like isoform X1 [Haliotis cracherodii]|uniref:monocarboxylate transporter 13-like isoform X1 n=1 Tax=Haliotis cracherodii TaxID=6455 RepID=UPI0039E8906F
MSQSDIDGGWAWVILGVSFCGMLLTGFHVYSLGIIMAALLDEIDSDLTRVSWVGSIYTAALTLSGPLIGWVINRYGCRVAAFCGGMCHLSGMICAFFATNISILIVTFSFLGGIGMGFCLTSSLVVSGYYFKKYRPMASGITVSGAAFGMFVGPPVIRLLIDNYMLRGTFLVLGALGANMFVLGMFMRPSPTEKDNFRKDAGIGSSARQSSSQVRNQLLRITSAFKDVMGIVKSGPFLCYLFSTFAFSCGETAAIYHLPNYSQEQGTSKMASATLMTAMGVTSLCSRLLTGFAASDPNIGPELLLTGMMGMIGILTITFPLYSATFGTQVLYAAGYGLYSGGINAVMTPLTAELISLEKLAIGFGLLCFTSGIGCLIGAPIAGVIVDSGGTYTHSYIYAGTALLLGSAVSVPISLRDRDSVTWKAVERMDVTIDVVAETEQLKTHDITMEDDGIPM